MPRLNADEVIERAEFTVYGLEQSLVRSARISNWSSQDGRIMGVGVEHRARIGRRTTCVRVTSAIEDPRIARPVDVLARYELADELSATEREGYLDSEPKGLSAEARILRLADHNRRTPEPQELAEQARVEALSVPVEGAVVRFTLARNRSGPWLAAAIIDANLVTVTSRDFEPGQVRLASIRPHSAYF